MTQENECPDRYASDAGIPQLPLAIKKLGLASHHYGTKEKRKDFKDDFLNILSEFDSRKCDSVLFSSYTLKTNSLENLNLPGTLQDLSHIRIIFFEELLGVRQGKSCTRYHVWMKSGARWVQHICHQSFGTLKTAEDKGNAAKYVDGFAKKRVSGNFALMLCGETNIIVRKPNPYEITDGYGFLDHLPASGKVILNPVHDVMSSYMAPKRKFLSQGRRLIVSVWNKGRLGSDGKARDGKYSLLWTVYFDGAKVSVPEIADASAKLSKVTLGIVDIGSIMAGRS